MHMSIDSMRKNKSFVFGLPLQTPEAGRTENRGHVSRSGRPGVRVGGPQRLHGRRPVVLVPSSRAWISRGRARDGECGRAPSKEYCDVPSRVGSARHPAGIFSRAGRGGEAPDSPASHHPNSASGSPSGERHVTSRCFLPRHLSGQQTRSFADEARLTQRPLVSVA